MNLTEQIAEKVKELAAKHNIPESVVQEILNEGFSLALGLED